MSRLNTFAFTATIIVAILLSSMPLTQPRVALAATQIIEPPPQDMPAPPPPAVVVPATYSGRSGFAETTTTDEGTLSGRYTTRPQFWLDAQQGVWSPFDNKLLPAAGDDAAAGFALVNGSGPTRVRFRSAEAAKGDVSLLQLELADVGLELEASNIGTTKTEISDSSIT